MDIVKKRLTPIEVMLTKWSFIYFILILSFMLLAIFLLAVANVSLQGMVLPIFICASCVFFSYKIYQRKRKGLTAELYSWLSATIFVLLPFLAKYNYIRLYGWDVALASYNSSVLVIIAVVITQFLYNKRLFKVMVILALANWIIFLVSAHLAGAVMSFQSIVNGHGVTDFVVTREIFIIIVGILVWFAVYRFIPITESYERQTTRQRNIIEEHNIQLEKKVTERTRELNEANEKLKHLDKLKSNFFANISHEIRTPLTLILSPIESYLQGDYDSDIDSKFFQNLHRNAIRLLKLINNILDISKIEAGRMMLSIIEFDIVKLFRTYISMVETLCHSKGISINLKSDTETILIYADFDKIDKAIMNLFSNALKFTETGGSINIRVRDNNTCCIIEFEDTGIGIQQKYIDEVFDRFSQAGDQVETRRAGTGIGLALSKEFIELHDGTISVQSRHINEYPNDHGTLFTITIPALKSHYEQMGNVEIMDSNELRESFIDYNSLALDDIDLDSIMTEDAAEEEDIPSPSAGTGKDRLLVVDDNAEMRNFINSLLRTKYDVHFAVNGAEGIESAKKLNPDLIITDVMMPVMDGYEMTKIIKGNDILKTIPVIMLTAKSELSQKIEGLEYGADDYLTKPFNSKELFTRIESLLKTYEFQRIIAQRNREIESDLDTSKLILEKLMPRELPSAPEFTLHVTYIPMDKVGGDFYHYSYREGMVEIFIADVSGHGLLAAFLALITKMSFDNLTEQFQQTSEVLKQINNVLCKISVQSNFVTAFYGIWDIGKNTLKFSSAGHCPPIIYRNKTGEFFDLLSRSNPMGWFSTITFQEDEFRLESGDRLFLYTDGITECITPERKLFGTERLKEFIKNNINLAPEDFAQKLLSHLQAFSGSDKYHDDLTFIICDVS